MIKYTDFYRRFGVRKESSLKGFRYLSTERFQLPRDSVYHYLPSNSTEKSVDPNDLLVANHPGDLYCVHFEQLTSFEGGPTPLPMNRTSVIRAIEKQNRKLRRVRQMSAVVNNPKALLIYNYSLLQHFYRYRVNFLNPWQRWYNTYATMWENINKTTAETERQHFVRVDIPLRLPSIALLNRAANNITRDILTEFNSPQLLQLLDLWKWAGAMESAMGKLQPEARERVNLVFIDGGFVGVINLFSLYQWQGAGEPSKDKDEVEDDSFINELERRYAKKLAGGEDNGRTAAAGRPQLTLFQRKLLFFMIRMAQLRTVNNDVVETNAASKAEQDEAEEAAQSSTSDPFDTASLFDQDDEPEELEQPPEIDAVDTTQLQTAPGEREAPVSADAAPVAASEDEPLFKPVTDDELMDDSLFEINPPELVEVKNVDETQEELNVLDAPEIGVVNRAYELHDRGLISTAEVRRFEKLAVKYKQLENPFAPSETVEELATITDEMLAFDEKECTLEKLPGVDDQSMLKSSLLQFDAKYIKNVLHRDIAQAVLSLQRVGVAVTDYQVDRVIDAANKYDVYTIKVTPVAGAASTLRFTLPVFEEDGSWTADGARYMLRKQRGDAPIHKVNERRVALTSYDSKLFVERSDKVVHNFDDWIQAQIIAKMVSGSGEVTSINYRSGKASSVEGLPRHYTGLAARFSAITTPTWELSFDYDKVNELYGDKVVKFLASQKLVPFARSGSEILAMDDAGAVYTLTGNHLASFGDIGTVFDIDMGKAPLEMVEMKVAGKKLPLGIALCYMLGIDKVLKRCNCTPRRVPKGQRLQLERDEFAVRFFDESLVFSKQDRMAALLFSGFQPFARAVANYPFTEYNKKDVYLNVIEGRGLGMRQLHALTDHRLFFIDPITLGLLKEMGEPTDFVGLLFRSTELLLNDDIPVVDDRFKGYERVAAAVYRELARAAKVYRRRPLSAKASIELNPNAVWMAIQTDPANGLIEDANPINYLKEQEAVTFGGTGGRSSRSMVRGTRRYNPRDFGVISEATKDSSDVAISTYFTANPKLKNLRGTIDPADFTDFEMTSAISTSALCAPSALNDDPKRVNFINIQNSSTVASVGNKSMPMRTGYESVIAHRVGKLYAFSTKQAGKVVEVSRNHIAVEYEDGTRDSCQLGRRFGVVAGTTVPHTVVTDMRVGDTFNRTEILAWNEGFYMRDRFNPRQVLARTGTLVTMAVVDSSDTHEDSSAISAKLALEMATELSETRVIDLRFDQSVANLVKKGDRVEPDTILCVIEDPLTGNAGLFDTVSEDTLRLLSANTPKAESEGVIESIEVFYRGDKDDMSESLREVADYYDAERRKLVRSMRQEASVSGEVFDRVRIGGRVLEYDRMVIRLQITHLIPMGVGDKGVFANQMKTVVGRVFSGEHVTESGVPYDTIFSNSSFFNRIVESPYKWGSTNSLLLKGSRNTADIYFGSKS